MLDQVEEITATFKNGNQLILCLKESTFAGHKPALLWELFYAEKVFESPNWQNNGSAESHFDAVQTEYFPASMLDTASVAFNKRLSSIDPTRVSGMGFPLDYLINK